MVCWKAVKNIVCIRSMSASSAKLNNFNAKLNNFTDKLNNLNFHALEVVFR